MTVDGLSPVLTAAHEAIGADGELPYPWRRRIWQVLVDQLGSDAGARAWSAIQVACAHQAWPVWQAKFPREDKPMALLRTIEAEVASGQVDRSPDTRLGSLKAFLDGKFELGQDYFAAIYAGYACLSAASELLFGGEPPDVAGESELDAEEWDASFNASLANAGGAVWEEGVGHPDARRRYWEWFLADLVPRVAAQFGSD